MRQNLDLFGWSGFGVGQSRRDRLGCGGGGGGGRRRRCGARSAGVLLWCAAGSAGALAMTVGAGGVGVAQGALGATGLSFVAAAGDDVADERGPIRSA